MSLVESKCAVEDLVTRDAYRVARQNIFPSVGSFEWHLRQNRERLIRAGALKLIGGSWRVHPQAYDAVLMEEGTRAALRRLVAA